MSVVIGPVAPPELHLMTFNVRRRLDAFPTRSVDRWRSRRAAVADLVASEAPTVLGVQEALPDQAGYLRSALGDRYRRVGFGRRPGPRGEGCPILYDTERLELLEAEQTALSDRPLEAGSRSWGNPLPRVVVRATMRDRVSGEVFQVLNTHLDPFSERSRTRSTTHLRRIVAGRSTEAVVMGDFNADPASRTIRALVDGGVLRDTWTAALEQLSPQWRTYSGYRAPRRVQGERGRGRIDGIFVTSGFDVARAAISTRMPHGRWPSDHLPVQVVARMSRGRQS